jgi:hypothetical protein
MECVGLFFRRLIPFALLGQDMDQNRSVLGIAHHFQGVDKITELMAGNRSDIVKFERLKEHTGGEKTLQAVLALFEDVENMLTNIGELS